MSKNPTKKMEIEFYLNLRIELYFLKNIPFGWVLLHLFMNIFLNQVKVIIGLLQFIIFLFAKEVIDEGV